MKKHIFFVFAAFAFCPNCVSAQLRLDSIYLRPIIGIRNHNEQQPNLAFAGRSPVINSPVVGLRLGVANLPISISFQKDVYVEPRLYVIDYPNFSQQYPHAIQLLWSETFLQAEYRFKPFSVGLGHYWAKRESLGHFLLGDLTRYFKGVTLNIRSPLKWIDVEFRTKLTYALCSNRGFCVSRFAALGWSQHSLLFLYDIGRSRKEPTFATKRKTWNIEINGLLGFRIYPRLNEVVLRAEQSEKISFAPAFGLEVVWPKIHSSLNLEKDVWLAFNGGSRERLIKGYVRNYFVGGRYHCALKNDRHLRFGVGGAFVKDIEKRATITPELEKRFRYLQVKGIGVSVSYEVFKNTDLEFRHMIALEALNEKTFSPTRMSLGLLHRHNPLR
jgi:hypothetical protein